MASTTKKKDLLSNIISVMFHPLLMPTYVLVILFNTPTQYAYFYPKSQLMIYLLVIVCTVLIPISFIPFLVNLKVVSDVTLKNHRERTIPLFISSASFYFAFYLLNNLPYSSLGFIKMVLLASSILIFICLLISFKWKISAHLIGIGGLLASLFFYAVYFVVDYTYILMIISIIAGLSAFARLKLHAHNSAQVYSGFILGFVGMFFTLYFGIIG